MLFETVGLDLMPTTNKYFIDMHSLQKIMRQDHENNEVFKTYYEDGIN